MWSADGQFIYYVSEFHGTPANIVRAARQRFRPTTRPSSRCRSPSTRTTPSAGPASAATATGSSTSAAPTSGWSRTKEGSQPRKLAIEVHADDKSNTEQRRDVHQRRHRVRPVARREARRLRRPRQAVPACRSAPTPRSTQTDQYGRLNDHGIAWAPDGSKIIFVSDRERPRGHLLCWRPTTPSIRSSPRPTKFKATQLTDTRDGRRRRVSPPTASASPSSRRQTVDDEPRRQRSESDRQRARSSTTNGRPTANGSSTPAGTARSPANCTSSRRRTDRGEPGPQHHPLRHLQRRRDLEPRRQEDRLPRATAAAATARFTCCRLQKPVAPGVSERSGAATVDIDWDDIHLRAEPVRRSPSSEAAISPDGTQDGLPRRISAATCGWPARTAAR